MSRNKLFRFVLAIMVWWSRVERFFSTTLIRSLIGILSVALVITPKASLIYVVGSATALILIGGYHFVLALRGADVKLGIHSDHLELAFQYEGQGYSLYLPKKTQLELIQRFCLSDGTKLNQFPLCPLLVQTIKGQMICYHSQDLEGDISYGFVTPEFLREQ